MKRAGVKPREAWKLSAGGTMVKTGRKPGMPRDPNGDLTQCVDCGGALAWDPLVEGVTQGGLALVGGLRCADCGRTYLSRRSKPREDWKLSAGGLSVETGVTRLRCESLPNGGADGIDGVRALMARVSRLPELEAALRRIALVTDDALAADIREMARRALGEGN